MNFKLESTFSLFCSEMLSKWMVETSVLFELSSVDILVRFKACNNVSSNNRVYMGNSGIGGIALEFLCE